MAEIPEKVKKTATDAKAKAGELAGKAGEKMPPKVKETYGKVSEKAKSLIPGEAAATDEAASDAEDSSDESAGDEASTDPA